MVGQENSKRNRIWGEGTELGPGSAGNPAAPFPREWHCAFWDPSVLKASSVLEKKPGPRISPPVVKESPERPLGDRKELHCPLMTLCVGFWSLSTLLGRQTLLFCPDPGRGHIGFQGNSHSRPPSAWPTLRLHTDQALAAEPSSRRPNNNSAAHPLLSGWHPLSGTRNRCQAQALCRAVGIHR